MDDPETAGAGLDASAEFLAASRFWIQKVLVPVAVLIGVCGNVITVMVLTRRRMRCTTTIYLTALAVADVVYLLFVLLLSFEKYDRIHEQRFELYWRFFGISHWLCDAASSTSVWLTVTFTIERYIVVCHPIKGKVHCTEARAKNIITVVSILCLVSTASTTFEYQLKVDEKCVQKYCDDNTPNITSIVTTIAPLEPDKTVEYDFAELSNMKRDVSSIKKATCDQEVSSLEDALTPSAFNASDCCQMVYFIGTEPTNLANNSVYTTAFYWFSSIGFGLLPLVLIATFNTFLVHAVYRSQKQRRRLTNAAENSSQNNENRITLLLISVVILFLICQTPTAVYLIYAAFPHTKSRFVINIEKGLGNIFNFLLTLNAACNFILYCVLSAKFRRTFRLVFCQRKALRPGANAFGASIIRNTNRRQRHLAAGDDTSFVDSAYRGTGTYTTTAAGGATPHRSIAAANCDTTCTVVSSQENGTSNRYSNLPQHCSEEEDNSDVEDCNKDLIDKKQTTNGRQIVSVKKRNGNQQASIKTPRNLETLSFTSIPRTRPMLMRPLGKARSTDLVV